MEFTQVINNRKSVRAYQPTQISDAQLQAVLDAATHAPVGMAQFEKVQLIVVQDPAILAQLVDAAREFAPPAIQNEFDPLHGAPTVIYVAFAQDGDLITGCNVGCIMENMLLAAFDQGLGSLYVMGMVQMGNNSPIPAQLLGVPEGFRLVSAVALGYPVEEIAPRPQGSPMSIKYVK